MEIFTEGVLITGLIFFSIVIIIKILSDNRIKNRLIEKEMINENLKYLYYGSSQYLLPSSMKWGMVLIGIGLAIFIGMVMPSEIRGEITAGCIFLMAGIGLLIYYLIARKISERS